MRPRVDSCRPSHLSSHFFHCRSGVAVIGWTTCAVFFSFNSCQGSLPQPEITSISPDAIHADASSVPLTVTGKGFVPASQILWNGNALATAFVDSQYLQATITQQTFDSFGGSAGTSVPISVMSPTSVVVVGCPIPQLFGKKPKAPASGPC